MQIAGEGDPLVFLHGAGTVTGFDALLPLAERFRLIVPFHPGFGPSADDTTVDDIHDYRRHYLDLFDELGLEEMALAGHSLGGWLAANFAADHAERVTRLVLAAPFGHAASTSIRRPTSSRSPATSCAPYLTADLSIFEGHVPMPPTPEFLADRYRESTSAARLMWTRPYDLKLHRWLHRLTMPTLLLWGDADRLIPVEQAPVWAEPHPRRRGQDAARRRPSDVRRESRGRRRGRQLRGRGADGLTPARATVCALRTFVRIVAW